MKEPRPMKFYLKSLFLAMLVVLVACGPVAALTIVNQGPGAVNNFSPDNVVSVAVTTDITSGTTVSWGLQGGTGNLSLGSIQIPSGQTVGFGSGAVPDGAAPGAYTLFAQEGTSNATGQAIQVVGPPQQPTQPPVITHVEKQDINTIQGVYKTWKTEVEVTGTCEFGGMTIEVMLDGALVGSVYSTGQTWGATVTIPADGNVHRIQAQNAVGPSNQVQVEVDTNKPTFAISYSPVPPFSDGVVQVRVTASEEVRELHLNMLLPDGTPAPVADIAVIPAGATSGIVWEGTITIASANGKPSVNGIETTSGQVRMLVDARDMANPVPGQFGTEITSGEIWVLQLDGPDASNATIVVENGNEYVNKRNLSFTWQGFKHNLGVEAITSYWFKAVREGEAAPDPAQPSVTTEWTNFPTAGGADPFSSVINVTQDGTYSVYVKAEDRLGKFSGFIFDEIKIDATGPAASNPSPANGAASTDVNQTISVELREEGSGIKRDSVVMIVNGERFGLSGSSNPDASPALKMYPKTGEAGVYVLAFNPKLASVTFPAGQIPCSIPETVEDTIGNKLGSTSGGPGVAFTWTFNMNVDTEAPIPQNPTPQNLYLNNKRQVIRLELRDPDLIDASSVRFDVNGLTFNPVEDTALSITDGAGGPDGSVSVLIYTPAVDFADGTVSCSLQSAKDRAGNTYTGPYNFTFWIDTTGPVASDPSPANGVTVENPTQVASVKIADALAGVADTVEITVSYQPRFSATPTFTQTIDTGHASLSYNPSSQMLSFNPQLMDGWDIRQGSITVVLTTAVDKAVTVADDGTTTPAPNALQNSPYSWTYFIGTSAGPIVSDVIPATTPTAKADPLTLRFILADSDFIDHASLIFDFNDRTFRDGDLGISWDVGTSSVLAGTHEAVIFDPPDDLIIQGTNELRIRAAKDRSGNALQNSPYLHAFTYDSQGPTATADSVVPASVIYDKKQIVTFDVTDNFSGIDPTTVLLRIEEQVDSNPVNTWDFGTATDPAILQYVQSSATSGKVKFLPSDSFSYVPGHNYVFSLMPFTKDKAGNPLNKAIGTPSDGAAGSPFTFTLRMAGSDEIVILDAPANDAYVNTAASTFMFDWHGPTTAPPAYRITISDNLSFNDEAPDHKWQFTTTSSNYSDSTFAVILLNGSKYYWYVEAVDTATNFYFAKSQVRMFTVDNVPPTTPDIRAIVDYRDIDPDHINWNPYSSLTYVKNKNIRIKVYCYETTLDTLGYKLNIYNRVDQGGTDVVYNLVGTHDKPVCEQTNEVDITLPTKNGEYQLVARITDRAGNTSGMTPIAELFYDTSEPKVESITITDRSPNTSGYITSGESWIEVKFYDTIELLPLENYVVKPSIKFDPAGASRGTGPVEVSELSVSGKSLIGKIVLPYGQSSAYDGMADVHVLGVMDAAYNMMQSRYYTQTSVFEIDTAPSFEVLTFLNPIDEKNILINIYASETLLQQPTLWIKNSQGYDQNVPVNIMERDLFASTWGTAIGEQMIRVSGPDAKGNIGFFPTQKSLGESSFLSTMVAAKSPTRMASTQLGISLDIPSGALAKTEKMHIFPFNTSWMQTADGNVARMPAQNVEVLESELTSVGHQFNISPGRIDFNRPVGVSVDLVRELKDEERQQIGLYRSDDGVNFTFVGKALNGNRLMGDINGACIVGAFLDSRPPVIDQLSFEAGQMLDSDRPMITARVRDGGSGISSETLFIRVDGREMSARYDGSKEMMIFEPSVSLAAGTHNLEIIARDRVGNETAMRAIAFQVPQSKPDILKAISWPNPASVMSTISFSLSGVTIGQTLDVNVKIYDGSGRLVTSIDPLAAGLNYRALWDLTNRRGGRVANGVYFYRIRVRMGDNLLQKTGKIAVLR